MTEITTHGGGDAAMPPPPPDPSDPLPPAPPPAVEATGPARGPGAVVGLLALGAGLAVASLTAAVADVDGPVVAVGNRVVDGVPRWLKNWAIDTFGTNDKPVLLAGVAVALVLAAVAAGRVALRRLGPALVGVTVVALLGVTAAVTRTGSRGADWLPPVVGAAAAALVLAGLTRRARRGRPAEPEPTFESPLTHDRRRFLYQAGLVGVGAAGVAGVARLVRSDQTRTVQAAAATVELPVPTSPAAAVGADATAAGGLEPYLTPTGSFYRIDTALSVPNVDPRSWSLTIGGMVDRPITLSYADLLARPMVERIVTLSCVSNEVGGDLIGNARWLGVPLRELLEEAGVQPGATQIASTSVDGWTCGFPTAVALDGRDALVAVAMNGEPLPRKHGFPARLVVPGLYGYVSATKWLEEIRLTTWEDFDGYWVPRGWSKEGPIKTQSRIDVPRAGERPAPGRVVIAGVAWAIHRGVTKVELQIDGAPWVEATLAAEPTVDGWRQWRYEWEAEAGRHTVRVRATDATGTVQSERNVDVAPDGAEGYHRRTIEVG